MAARTCIYFEGDGVIFISKNPKTDLLIIRDVPLIIAPIFVGIGAVLFAAAYAAEQNDDVRTTTALFAIGVAVTGLVLALVRVKTLVLNGTERTLTLREARLLGRRETVHALSATAQAEVVITKDSDGDDSYQACLANGDADTIELDGTQSFLRPSARIVMAINAWMRAS